MLERNEEERQMYNVLICGLGGQGILADAPGSENEHKIISYAKAFSLHAATGLLCFDDKCNKKSIKAMQIYGGCATTLRYACECKNIDIAVISTPDDTHFGILKQLAEYSLKLVICEKPLTTDLQQAIEIVQLYKDKNIPLMIDNTRNFIPELRNLPNEHGKAISGYALFNRGLFHSAMHIFGFFRMLGCNNYKIRELDELDFRVWILSVTFEDGFIWSEERITNDMPVWSRYDHHMKYVVENAYNFLEGKEPLFYTGEEALKDIEECCKLMGAK